MAPKRATRANLADTTATTFVTNAQLKAMIDQGVTDALAARDADRNTNGDDSHNSGTGGMKRTSDKRAKNKAKNDKTEHGNVKSAKSQSQKVKVNTKKSKAKPKKY
ncbi:hypothetical protein Tco_1337253 [Tanacetum coccineum]